MSFNIGLSGLYAANKQLNITGHNIANVATNGFKSSRAEFADTYAATRLGSGSHSIGTGVRLASISQQFGQGDVNNTGNVLDMGIQGQGFFVLSDNGSLTYTRAGAFKTDTNGYITNGAGTSRLRGYGVDADGKVINGVLTDLRIDTSNLQPKATGQVGSSMNFDSSTKAVAAGVVFDPAKVDTYTKKFTTPIYDSQGNEHQMDQYMVKTADNTWKVYTVVDGRNADGSKAGPAPDTPPPAVTLNFNSTGKLLTVTGTTAGVAVPVGVAGNSIALNAWRPGTVDATGAWTANGANFSPISVDMSKITQFNSATARLSMSQDGYSTGQITNLTIDSTGTMFANFSNQQSKAIGQVALASFSNEQGLQAVGGTGWKETFASGGAVFDAPKTGTLGALASNSLEESNVNLTSELVDLIKAQSNYQANAKTISTNSTIMQTIIQMT